MRRISSLYIPLIFWNVFYLISRNLFIKLNLYTVNPAFLDSLEGSKGGLIGPLSIHGIIQNLIKIFTFGGTQQLAGISWFLVVLFTITVLYTLIDYLLKTTNNHLIYQIFISIVFFSIGYTLSLKHISLYRHFSVSLSVYILFTIGCLFSHFQFNTKYLSKIIRFAIILFLFINLCICTKFGSIELSNNSYNNPIFLLITSTVGYLFIYNISYFIEKSKISKFTAVRLTFFKTL